MATATATAVMIGTGVVTSAPAGAQALFTRKIDFATQTAPLGGGYTRDYGLGYTAQAGFGWIDGSSSAARSLTADARYRPTAEVTDVRLETYQHFQKNAARPARWQLQVPAATYDVTVAVGDPVYLDGVHGMNVESTPIISNFTATPATKFHTATVRVRVTDGFLTLSTTGTNTKIDYIDVEQVLGSSEEPTTTTTTTTTSTTTTTTPTTPTTDPPSQSSGGLVLSSPDNAFAASPRLALAGVLEQADKPDRAFTLRNTTNRAINVTNVRITSFGGQGNPPAEFSLQSPTRFTVQPGQSTQVLVGYTARTFTNPERYGTLRITHDAGRELSSEVSGLSARGSSGNSEPPLQPMLNVVGYANANVTDGNEANLGSTRNPVGDEVLAPYFRRLDPSKPVELDMVTRYRGQTRSARASSSGWNPRGTNTKNEVVYSNDPGAANDNALGPSAHNQTVMPLTSGPKAFNPSGDFAIYSESFFTDDTKNNGNTHNFRVYRGLAPDVAVPAGVYILALDFGFEGSFGKNHDFQDTVFIIKNAVPVT